MPFIRAAIRKWIDEDLDPLIENLKKMEEPSPMVSYIILKLMVEVYGDDVMGMIRAIGTVEETKMTYYAMYMQPLEDKIRLRRWLDPNGSY